MNVATRCREKNLLSPCEYFKTRQGLLVSFSFTKRILLKSNLPQYSGYENVISKTLPRTMSDPEIINEMMGGMNGVRDHSLSLEQIMNMIDLQAEGEDGQLLNNGATNICYVFAGDVLCAVYLHWDLYQRKWDVEGWPIDEYGRWPAGRRVLFNAPLVL